MDTKNIKINIKKVLVLSVVCSLLVAFIGTATAENFGGNETAEMWAGLFLGMLIVLIVFVVFYKKGWLSFLTLKELGEHEDEKILKRAMEHMKESCVVYSGEFPSSIWDPPVDSIVKLVKERGKESVKLMSGQVVCIGSEKTGKPSKFLKEVINRGIDLYKTPGNKILPHTGECHFRVIDGKTFIFHYHSDDDEKRKAFYNKNSPSLNAWFEETFAKHLKGAERFNLEDAERQNALVIELKNPDENGRRYRYATEKEINEFKEYLKIKDGDNI